MSEGGGREGRDVAELADVIGRIREELELAQREGGSNRLKFLVERVNIEFEVQVRREGTGRAGLRIWVVTAEAGGSAARDTTHRIAIELKPHDGSGAGINVRGVR